MNAEYSDWDEDPPKCECGRVLFDEAEPPIFDSAEKTIVKCDYCGRPYSIVRSISVNYSAMKL